MEGGKNYLLARFGIHAYRLGLALQEEVHALTKLALDDSFFTDVLLHHPAQEADLAPRPGTEAFEEGRGLHHRVLELQADHIPQGDELCRLEENRGDQELAEDGDDHDHRGEDAELYDGNELGNGADGKAAGEGDGAADHGPNLVMDRRRHGGLPVLKLPHGLVVAAHEVDGVIDGDTDGDVGHHGGADVQGDIEEAHDSEDADDGEDIRDQGDKPCLHGPKEEIDTDEDDEEGQGQGGDGIQHQAFRRLVDEDVLPGELILEIRVDVLAHILPQFLEDLLDFIA